MIPEKVLVILVILKGFSASVAPWALGVCISKQTLDDEREELE